MKFGVIRDDRSIEEIASHETAQKTQKEVLGA
jgi:hypothetical protein